MSIEVNGARYSYECEDLIEEVREEIELYDAEHSCFAICRAVQGVTFVTDYCLYEEELHEAKLGLAYDETAFRTTLGKLLALLIQQNEI